MSVDPPADPSATETITKDELAGVEVTMAPTTPSTSVGASPVTAVSIIYNPYGGKGKGKKLHGLVLSKLQKAFAVEGGEKTNSAPISGIQIKSCATQYAGHATVLCKSELLELNDAGCILVVIGGDGTLNECINGLAKREAKKLGLGSVAEVNSLPTRVCFIPGGTGNALATDLGFRQGYHYLYGEDKKTCKRVYKYAQDAVDLFLEAEGFLPRQNEPATTAPTKQGNKSTPILPPPPTLRAIDVGCATYRKSAADDPDDLDEHEPPPALRHRLFHNMLGMAIVSDANIRAERCRCCGPMRYDCAFFAEIVKLNPNKGDKLVIKTEYKDGAKEEIVRTYQHGVLLALVQNTVVIGDRVPTCPGAKVDDGELNALYGEKTGCCGAASLFGKVNSKGGKHISDPSVVYEKVKKWSAEPQPAEGSDKVEAEYRLNLDGENVGCCPVEASVRPGFLKLYCPGPAGAL
mmetsp:Transcript_13898/g.34325  ORF Transcript_13898/g.34325 Transcript_13898/m.34325 type:complete len:463 (-) Transcript_13898:316-1704(-)|eukprot:CAMPEP_0179000102 /NCGR_PEP_ID=MMETSP0795-20121207/10469_1 /TAXON_ID=88552 /ORGANISM="Amoebophrya sp., Strain Ameob2" /LENGTH=462 /DNA_ID=CAMNT_0020693029 /DNA_START=39 /DNA_END=1427 /DNA_ORIENTATION=-